MLVLSNNVVYEVVKEYGYSLVSLGQSNKAVDFINHFYSCIYIYNTEWATTPYIELTHFFLMAD